MYKVFLVLRVLRNGSLGLVVAVHGAEDVLGVLHPVDVTDLIAVVGRNGNLRDAESLMIQFDDDL